MAGGDQTTREHHRLRLAPEDVALLWGIVGCFAESNATGERWPRIERIMFDLTVMMEQQEQANG